MLIDDLNIANRGCMAKNRKSITPNRKEILIGQVNGLCPLSKTPLFYEKNGANHKDYEIAHIYPLHPKPKEVVLLKVVKRLSEDPEHDDNLIPLCTRCHNKFDKPRTVDGYNRLYQIKKGLISRAKQAELWKQHSIQSEINVLIDSLATGALDTEDDNTKYEPKKVEEKADDTLLPLTKKRIKNNVRDYFPHVKTKFASIEKMSPSTSLIIAQQINTYYLIQRKIEDSQQKIYENMVEWIIVQTETESADAADIVASYFVQNCEIF